MAHEADCQGEHRQPWKRGPHAPGCWQDTLRRDRWLGGRSVCVKPAAVRLFGFGNVLTHVVCMPTYSRVADPVSDAFAMQCTYRTCRVKKTQGTNSCSCLPRLLEVLCARICFGLLRMLLLLSSFFLLSPFSSLIFLAQQHCWGVRMFLLIFQTLDRVQFRSIYSSSGARRHQRQQNPFNIHLACQPGSRRRRVMQGRFVVFCPIFHQRCSPSCARFKVQTWS